MKKAKKVILIVLCAVLALAVVLTGTYYLLRYFGYRGFHKDDTHITNDNITIEDDIITYKNQKYRLNENMVSILVIGVDKESLNADMGIGKNGQADCIFLACIDTEKKSYTVIPISRESIVNVDTYSVSGEFAGAEKEQICLSYAYGKDAKESSENVMKAVKRMFYGININSYVTIDIDGFSELSKLAGSITLTSLEDISSDRFSVSEGEVVTLSGKDAVKYIRLRGDDIDANNRRMKRQKQFFSALVTKIGNNVMENFTRLADYYGAMKPYTSTNIDLSGLTYLASTCLTRDIGSKIVYKNIDGSMTMGKFAEFNVNEESLLDLVIETFYVKVDKQSR